MKKAYEGKTWRDHKLHIRTVEGGRGRGAIRYEVAALSLPKEQWFSQFLAPTPTIQANTPETALPSTLADDRSASRAEQNIKYHIIQPALTFPKGSKLRAEAVQRIVASKHLDIDGNPTQFSMITIYLWIRLYEQSGLAGLEKKARKDKGHSRQVICRAWDKGFHKLIKNPQAVADEFTAYIRGLWANGVSGWREAQQMGQTKLAELTALDLGRKLDIDNLDMPKHQRYGLSPKEFDACKISRGFVETQRSYRLIYIKESDAKLFFDKIAPKLKRERGGILPNDVVFGDVHPIDIRMMRELVAADDHSLIDKELLKRWRSGKGTEVYARAIAWQDLATNRVWLDLIILPKGESVRREHIAMSFANMASVWGLPRSLYLDNGSEYNWAEMMGAFNDMSRLSQDIQFKVHYLQDDADVQGARRETVQAIVRAQPYNAPAKNIEGLFSVLEHSYFKKITGWVGGDRQRKKTHNVGKAPIPYPFTADEFHGDIAQCLNYYHSRPQQGALQGKSPYQTLEEFIGAGWTAVKVKREEMMLIFSEREQRIVYAGGYIRWNNRWFQHDALVSYVTMKGVQGRLNVRLPKHDPRCVFVQLPDGGWVTAKPAQHSQYVGDASGPQHKAKMEKQLRVYLHELKGDCGRIHWQDEIQRQIEARPEIPFTSEIDIAEATAMQKALDTEDTQRILEAAEAERKRPEISQWAAPGQDDDLTDGVVWEDD